MPNDVETPQDINKLISTFDPCFESFNRAMEVEKPIMLYRYRSASEMQHIKWLEDSINNTNLYCSPRLFEDTLDLRIELQNKVTAYVAGLRKVMEDEQNPIESKLRMLRDAEKLHSKGALQPFIDAFISELDNEAIAIQNRKAKRNMTKILAQPQHNEVTRIFNNRVEDDEKGIRDKVSATSETFNELEYDFVIKVLAICNAVLGLTRIACFSTSWEIKQMWDRYDVCLQFDTNKIARMDSGLINGIRQVSYVEKLDDVVTILIQVTTRILNGEHDTAAKLLSTKISRPYYVQKRNEYAYEQEWRLLYSPRTIGELSSRDGVYIKFIKPSEIILGTEIAPASKERILCIAAANKIQVSQMQKTSSGFSKYVIFDGKSIVRKHCN